MKRGVDIDCKRCGHSATNVDPVPLRCPGCDIGVLPDPPAPKNRKERRAAAVLASKLKLVPSPKEREMVVTGEDGQKHRYPYTPTDAA